MIEIADACRGERFAKNSHAMLPLRFPNHRQPIEIAKMARTELGVFPECAGRPAMEIMHHDKHAKPPLCREGVIHCRDETIVVFLDQLAGHEDFQSLPAVGFLELDCHYRFASVNAFIPPATFSTFA